MIQDEQVKLGILMLDTRFPRIPGDVGNPRTWGFPVTYATVPGATPHAVICDDTEPFVEAFIEKGHSLVAAGCTGIATTCGFLALIRPRLAAALDVPVAASALEQAAQIRGLMPAGKHVSILTISRESLTPSHLCAAGVPADTHIAGVDGTHFARTILGNRTELDISLARSELVKAAQMLLREAPKTGAILLECTNMVPYASEIQAVTGVPVYSIYTYLTWFHESLRPCKFPTS